MNLSPILHRCTIDSFFILIESMAAPSASVCYLQNSFHYGNAQMFVISDAIVEPINTNRICIGSRFRKLGLKLHYT